MIIRIIFHIGNRARIWNFIRLAADSPQSRRRQISAWGAELVAKFALSFA